LGLFYTKAKELKKIYEEEVRKYGKYYSRIEKSEIKGLNINLRTGALWDNNSIKENKFVDWYHIELLNY
jgi:hypothetical protein